MEIIQSWPIVAQVLACILALNVALSGLKAGLDIIKDKTASQVDNKMADALGKAAALLGKILDMVGYNPKH